MAEAKKGWDEEANQKMAELSGKFKYDGPRDVKGNKLVGKPGRLSKQAMKVNMGFDNTPEWIESELMDQIYEDFLVNEHNKVNINQKTNFTDYLLKQVMPTLTARYNDLLNSMLHHEQAVHMNHDIAPMTKVEAEKVKEVLDKTAEAVVNYLGRHHVGVSTEQIQKWKQARDYTNSILKALPSGEGVYKKV